MESHADPLHLLFFPFLTYSHMTPMLEMARLAAERGVRITLATTPANAYFFRPTVDQVNANSCQAHPTADIRLIPFPAAEYGIPDDCETSTSVPLALLPNFFNAVNALSVPLDALLHELRPDALVSDELFPWTTELASEHGVPRLIFQTTGLFPLCAANDLGLYRPYEAVTDRDEPFEIPGFPHPVKLKMAELPKVFDFPFMLSLLHQAELTSYGAVVNSFYDLEPDYAKHYYKVGPREVFIVGPVLIAGIHPPWSLEYAGGGKDEAGRHPCLSWLDGKPNESVVYVSFGTQTHCHFTDLQLRELALGLEASGQSFLWALRADVGCTGKAAMPEGYEERVAGRGLITRDWVPQREILAHPSVGGYVVHCGWNSVMEAVCAGVRLITWPLHSEQFLVERLLVDVLGVARPMWEGVKSVKDEGKALVPAETVANSVAELMGRGERAEAAHKKIKELREAAQKAVAEGGSSHGDIGRMIEGLMRCRMKRQVAMQSK